MVIGIARRSSASGRPSWPATSTPRRIACKLKSVDITVNTIDEMMLVFSAGVPRIQ